MYRENSSIKKKPRSIAIHRRFFRRSGRGGRASSPGPPARPSGRRKGGSALWHFARQGQMAGQAQRHPMVRQRLVAESARRFSPRRDLESLEHLGIGLIRLSTKHQNPLWVITQPLPKWGDKWQMQLYLPFFCIFYVPVFRRLVNLDLTALDQNLLR